MMKKHILITGSTDGIGKLTAIKFAKEGHTVYLHGRNEEKLSKVITEIKEVSNNDNIEGFVADFSDLGAVNNTAEKIKSEVPKLDVLINNAGIFNSAKATNKDGLDLRIVVNYLAPFVFTNALMPLLETSTNSRIINLSSAAQDSFDNTAFKPNYEVSERLSYGQSKLALTMWSFNLADALKDTTVIAVNPGSLLDTKMVHKAFGQVWSSADKGVNILYHLAMSEAVEGITGKYFDNDAGSFSQAHPDAYDIQKIEQLLTTTKNLLEA